MRGRAYHPLALALLALLFCSCGQDSSPGSTPFAGEGGARWKIHTRFVDPAERARAKSTPVELLMRRPLGRTWEHADPDRPSATLRDDTRPVLATPRRSRAVYADSVPVPANRLLASPGRLVRELAPHFDWVLAPMLRDSIRKKSAPVRLPGVLVPRRTGKPGVLRSLRIEVPESMEIDRVDFFARAMAVPRDGRTRYQTGPLLIPDGARLELALGILEPARETGVVEFSVSTCDGTRCEPVFVERLEPRRCAEEGWQERVVDLGEHTGARRALRFDASWDADAPGAFSLPVFADPRIVVADDVAPKRPDIILLSIDTLRADHLPIYGYARETAPFMRDVLAARGTVFDDFVAAATTTGPSHMSMFTSLSPAVHGAAIGHDALQAPVSTLAMQLRDAGYETAAFTDDGPMDHERGFELGFDRYIENKSARVMHEGQVVATFERARRQLETFAGRPRFLFLHSFQVHGPYTPPPAYADLFADEAPGPGTPVAKVTAFAKAQLYDREIRYTDDALRELVAWLEERGFFENGLLVVTSDHGEAFQEHHVTGHGGLPHEELLRIPLLFFGAGVAEGRRVSQRVTHIDVMPTLLEWAGVEVPPHATGHAFTSLLRDDASPSGGPPERAMVSEAWAGSASLAPPALAVRSGPHKLLRFVGQGHEVVYRYHDLEADPREQVNRYAEMREDETVRALRELADGYVSAAEALRDRIGSPVAGFASGEAEEESPLDPEREAKLRALGYIE
jgi:arylsulfatase A-like enzyme